MGVQVRGGGDRGYRRRGEAWAVLEVTLAGLAAGLSAVRGDRSEAGLRAFQWEHWVVQSVGLEHG